MADINLSHAVRSNLLSLQSTAANMAKTQERLATGLKVNSALDNPTNFFTASALNSRAGDMANLLDSMSNGIKTIEAADNGIKSIVKITLTEQEPPSTWNKLQPSEYGFYANVNPAVDHPRWSQKSERRIAGDASKLFAERIPTLPFNGYGEQVASLYEGMDLRKWF